MDALSKAGYHFYTWHLVKLGSEYGEGVEIPYTHTVVTWPQVTAVDTTKFLENRRLGLERGPETSTLAQTTPPDSGPVQLELCGTENGELPEIGTINALLSLLGEQQVYLKLGLRIQPTGFWARRNWGSPGEVALFEASLNGVYDAAMVGDNNFSTEFDLDVRAGELVKYFREAGFRATISIEKNGGNPRQRITLGWDIL